VKVIKVSTYPDRPYINPLIAGPRVLPNPKLVSRYPIYLSFSYANSTVTKEYAQVMIPAAPNPYKALSIILSTNNRLDYSGFRFEKKTKGKVPTNSTRNENIK
jgi:hypothetical protein